MTIKVREVVIPACESHGGHSKIRVFVEWVCPVCGSPRGEAFGGISWDGSRRLSGIDAWINPCGHVDKYSDVRNEAAALADFLHKKAATDGHR